MRSALALSIAGVLAGPDQAAAHGYTFGVISLDISPGIFEEIRVISSGGEAYSSLADDDIGLGYDLFIGMDQGAIKAWTISWGECSGSDCLDEGTSGTRRLDGRLEVNDPVSVDFLRSIQIPLSAIGATPTVPIAATNDSAAMVQLCNDWVAGGGDITVGTTLGYDATVTVAVDAIPEEDLPLIEPLTQAVGRPGGADIAAERRADQRSGRPAVARRAADYQPRAR